MYCVRTAARELHGTGTQSQLRALSAHAEALRLRERCRLSALKYSHTDRPAGTVANLTKRAPGGNLIIGAALPLDANGAAS
jgi:hypothetical protein